MKNQFKKKKVAVLGLGLEGKDLVKFLLKENCEVTVFDQKEEKELDFSGINKGEISLSCGVEYLLKGLSNFDVVYRSPGVYRYLPGIIEAEKRGVEVSSAIKLFFDLCPAKIIGVTGTKGKGTTSTLIYRILKTTGRDAYLAGNIGKSYLELLPGLKTSSWVVLELSSFQLIDLQKSPHIAVVLNITLDHLDWHKDKGEYFDAKKKIVRHQTKKDFAVANFDYKASRNFSMYTKAPVFYFSKSDKVRGSYVRNGKIFLSTEKKEYEIGATDDLLLRGEHNRENVTAAICASRFAGAKIEAIKKAVFSFKGLKHRLELVGKVQGVSFYNDSFSTNPQPTIAAINSFTEPLTLILGGSDKELDYNEMAELMAKTKNLKTIVLIGEIAPKIKKAISKARFGGKIVELGKVNMDKIVKKSLKSTPEGGVVLLSPATASFDMFKDYKDRGSQFKQVVKALGAVE